MLYLRLKSYRLHLLSCVRSKFVMEKNLFLQGYNKMLETVEPSAIICLGEPFKEMDGNIIAVDYRASRKVVR